MESIELKNNLDDFLKQFSSDAVGQLIYNAMVRISEYSEGAIDEYPTPNEIYQDLLSDMVNSIPEEWKDEAL